MLAALGKGQKMQTTIKHKILSGFLKLSLLAVAAQLWIFYSAPRISFEITLFIATATIILAWWLGHHVNTHVTSHIQQLTQHLHNKVLATLDTNTKSTDFLRGSATLLTASAQEAQRRSEGIHHNTAANINLPEAENTAQLTHQALTQATEAEITSSAMVESTQQLHAMRQQLADVAENIKLLAMNLSIESTRNKTPSPLIIEAKQLARETSSLLENITSQLQQLTSNTAQHSSTLQSMVGTVKTLHTDSQKMASASESLNQVTQGLAGLTQITANAATAAQDMLKQSENINQQSQLMREEIDTFLEQAKRL